MLCEPCIASSGSTREEKSVTGSLTVSNAGARLTVFLRGLRGLRGVQDCTGPGRCSCDVEPLRVGGISGALIAGRGEEGDVPAVGSVSDSTGWATVAGEGWVTSVPRSGSGISTGEECIRIKTREAGAF